MNLLEGLNEPQREAVTHDSGPLLIFAGAGSGKTRTLTHRIAHLIQQRNVPPARILAVTFTNRAASEMRERLETLVGAGANRIWMGTFHAMCAQMLRINGGLIGIEPRFVIFDSDDSQRLMKDVLRGADVDSERFPPSRILGRIADAKNNLRSPADLEESAATANDRVVARLYRSYQERLRAASALDFDDLLGEAVRLLRESSEARDYWSERFLHVLIDEFQDVNAAQFKWAQLLAGKHRNICVVGDDDQCVPTGSQVLTTQGAKAIEDIQADDAVISGAGRGRTAAAAVQKTRSRPYSGKIVQATTRSGRVLRVTPNHMCFARLGVRADVHYVYLMYRQDKGYRIGIAVGARSDGRRTELINGLQVRTNQEHADKVWVLRVCPTREEAIYHEQFYAFVYGIPTTIFHVAGRGKLLLTQAGINRLYAAIDTRAHAARLMTELGLCAGHPHYRPGGLAGLDMPHRMVVHMTAFGGNAPSVQAPWFRHRVWLNTTDRVMEQQINRGGIRTRPGQRDTWRVERSYKEMERSARLAEQIAQAAQGADVARWAALTTGDKFAFQPAAHLHPTMIVPTWQDGAIEDDEITSVEHLDFNGTVHDLDVAYLHNYIVNGVVVHNSIYAWRGANVKIILDFELNYPDARVIRLEQNYRSTQPILDAAHGVISRNLGRKPKRLWTSEAGGVSLVVHGTANAQEEASWVVRQINDLLREPAPDGGRRRYSDFVILCRVNAQSRPFEEAFMRARVPLRLVGTQRFYERKEIKDLVAYLKLLWNPRDDIALMRAINVPARGIGAATVEKLQTLARQSDRSLCETILDESSEAELGRGAAAKIAPLRVLLQTLREDAAEARTVADLLSAVIERTQYLEFLQREKTLESVDRLANVQELLRAAEDFDQRMKDEDARHNAEEAMNEADETASSLIPHFSSLPESAPYLGVFLESSALQSGTDEGASGEAVTLMTLHSAKGLEFPIVFLVGMEQGLLPHARALWGEGAGGDELEEERRLCYVGLTRAREQVYLSHAAQRTLHGRTESTLPSQFLKEIPPHLLQRGGLASASGAGSWGPGAGNGNSGKPFLTTSDPPRTLSQSPAPNPQPPKFAIGDRVRHPEWGEGLVVNASPGGGRGEWVEVAFLSADAGRKKLVVAFAPLEKVAAAS